MTDRKQSPRIDALRDLEHSFQQHSNGRKRAKRFWKGRFWRPVSPRGAFWRDVSWRRLSLKVRAALRRRAVRRTLIGMVSVVGICAVGAIGLWLRLGAGPISLDFASPVFASAIEHTIGDRHKVEIGGTQLERDDEGHTSLRIRDMLIRDADGAIIASAPKAEVSVSTLALLTGNLRASRISLVGAELAVRIEPDGQLTISTGAERRPIAVTPAIVRPRDQEAAPAGAAPARTGSENFAALMRWIDKTASPESDNEMIGEIGLKNGSLTVDDQRNGKTWTFEQIDFSMNRLRRGGIVFNLSSDNDERPWQLSAAIIPRGQERRVLQVEARKVSTKDVLLAMRLDESDFQVDVPISGVVRAEIGPDFRPTMVEGGLFAERGLVGNPQKEDSSFVLDGAELTLDWDATRRTLVAPFKIAAGNNRITLLSQFEAPVERGGPWGVTVTGGSIVLGTDEPQGVPLVLNRIMLRGMFDHNDRRIELTQGEIGGGGVNLAMSGSLDYSAGEPVISGGMAGTPMKGELARRIWPVFVASKVRNWVFDNIQGGQITRMELAANAPIETLKEGGPPIPSDGLSVEIDVQNAIVQPVDGLPIIREADLHARIKGRNAQVSLGSGIVELESGRKLTLTAGLFEVPDTHPKSPPARAQFHIEGPVAAAAELMATDRLRDASSVPIDAGSSRGNLAGEVSVGLPIMRDPPKEAITYSVALELTNFVAERMMLNQKVEAQALKITANPEGYQIRGDVKLNGTPAALDYRKVNGHPDTEVRLQMTLDDGARTRFGFDVGSGVSGPVPIKVAGRIVDDNDSRFNVDADLTQARIDNLMPGWVKPAGKAGRATFMMVSKGKSTRFENVMIEGPGAAVKGHFEIDAEGDIVSANFPTFALSDGDKTSLRAERGNDGALKIVMRGDVYDGRNFVKSVFGGKSSEQKPKKQFENIDVDVKLGAIAGHNGEALRSVELKLSRRDGHIRNFTLSSKIGQDAQLTGDLRGGSRGQPVMYFETGDAGALFRFTDNYTRMVGGQMWVAIGPPTPDHAPQDGLINIRDFSIKGEPNLSRVARAGPDGVFFTQTKIEFTRTPGKLTIREGLVRGPSIGATIDGLIDFARNDVRLRGTFVPLYGLNNAFGQIPIVGLFLGGSKEGLLGITYEVTGAPNAPVLRVNPISAIAPGLLRKFFEFPSVTAPTPESETGAAATANGSASSPSR